MSARGWEAVTWFRQLDKKHWMGVEQVSTTPGREWEWRLEGDERRLRRLEQVRARVEHQRARRRVPTQEAFDFTESQQERERKLYAGKAGLQNTGVRAAPELGVSGSGADAAHISR